MLHIISKCWIWGTGTQASTVGCVEFPVPKIHFGALYNSYFQKITKNLKVKIKIPKISKIQHIDVISEIKHLNQLQILYLS